MKKLYTLLMAGLSAVTFAQQTISFEAAEGFQVGSLHTQNGWEVTEGSAGVLQNQVITSEQASSGTYSFKNAFEPTFNSQWFPIFGAAKTFATPLDYTNLTVSYDVKVTGKNGSDFEMVVYAIDANDEFVPVAGVGIENRGYIYLTKDTNYGFDYATAEWTPNEWVNIKIEISATEIKYYVNNALQNTIANFTQLNVLGLNMLHNNYGNDAYYDNFMITNGTLSTPSFQNSTVSVYPNPTSGTVTLSGTNLQNVDEVRVYNATGQQVLKTTQTKNIPMDALPNGIYFIKAVSPNSSAAPVKVIKN